MGFLVFFIAAVFVEGFIEYAVKGFLNGKFIKYVALLLGVLFAILYKLDLLAALNIGFTPISPYVSYVVTGLIIGRGSNYVNDLISLATRTSEDEE